MLDPSLFNAYMNWVLDRSVEENHGAGSIGNTDLVFADDAVIFA